MPDLVLERYGEMIFEDFKFNACLIGSSPVMAYKYALKHLPSLSNELTMIVDSGFSFTYALPILTGIPMKYAATWIDVGGKLLTNLLNEFVSYKEFNLTGETMLVNDIKEQLCYVSLDFESELDELSHNHHSGLIRDFVLPDYNKTFKGFVKPIGLPP